MNLTLKRFYQAVDLADPEKVTYYLVFESESGREILLPVQKETTEALVKMLYSQESPAQKPLTFQEDVGHEDDSDEFAEEDEEQEEKRASEEEEPEDPPDDDELGDGEGGDLEDLEPASGVSAVRMMQPAPPRRQNTPTSEDEVPSL